MVILITIMIGYLAVDAIISVYSIDRPQEPTKWQTAAGICVIDLALIVALVIFGTGATE